MTKLFRHAAVFATALTLLAGAPSAQDAQEILAKAREAAANPLLADGGRVRITGQVSFQGTDATFALSFDGGGRFREDIVGPLPRRRAFDGDVAWERDWNATPRVLDLGDVDMAALDVALMSDRWLAPELGLDFADAEQTKGEGATLSFGLAGGYITGRVTLDRKTWRLSSASWTSGVAEHTYRYSEWKERNGVTLAGRIEHTIGRVTDVYVLDTVARDTGDPAWSFEPQPVKDAHFDPSLPPDLEVKRAYSGHLLVHPKIDGRDLGWFIFDTGAGANVIATHVADRLDDGPFGAITARGVGGEIDAQFHRAGTLSLGPLTVRDPIFVGMDLRFLSGIADVEIGGVIGYGVLARSVVEYGVSEATIRLHDPARYELGGAKWRPLVLYRRHPHVRGQIEGEEALFKIDTGAGSDNVSVHAPAVQRLGLLDGRDTTAARAGGVGGSVATRRGMLRSLELGGHLFEGLEASFVTDDRGAFMDPFVDGNVGGGLLEPFTFILDYTNRRTSFVRIDG